MACFNQSLAVIARRGLFLQEVLIELFTDFHVGRVGALASHALGLSLQKQGDSLGSAALQETFQ